MMEDESALDGSADKALNRIGRNKIKFVLTIAGLILLGGTIIAILGGIGYLPVDPTTVIGLSIIATMVLVCCSTLGTIGKIASNMPNYSEMEHRFEVAMDHYEHEEYNEAIRVFKELLGPEKDHKRALFYIAAAYKQLDEWERVKLYIRRYLELQPKDREAWEMLARAHKTLFEYAEADEAQQRANDLSQ